MDVNEFFYLLQEYTLDNENYKKWRTIHESAFGKIFSSAFEGSAEAQIHLTAALIRISQRDFNGGLEILLKLKNFCYDDLDAYYLSYFIGLSYEFLENEEHMNKYYEKMSEYDEKSFFIIAFHPYYRTAKFAQRKSECKKAIEYYNKALGFYSKNTTDKKELENISQIYFDISTVYMFCHNYDKSWEYIEKSYKSNPKENPQREYIKAILYALEGKGQDAEILIDSMPDYLKMSCKQVTSAILNREELHYFAIEQNRSNYSTFWQRLSEQERSLLKYIESGKGIKVEEIISQWLTEIMTFMKKQLSCSVEKNSSTIIVKCKSGYTKTLKKEYEELFSMKGNCFDKWEFIVIDEY